MLYTFKVKGREDFVVQADGPMSAMSQANSHFGNLSQGAWMDGVQPRTYSWYLGNFFD